MTAKDGSKDDEKMTTDEFKNWMLGKKKAIDNVDADIGSEIAQSFKEVETSKGGKMIMLESRGLFGRKKSLIVRFFKANHCVGIKKVRFGATEVVFKKRMFSLNYDTMYMNQKGIPEINHDFDNGALSIQLNDYRDKYIAKADSQIIRDLYKRGTVKAIWGVDVIPFMLMIILAGALIVGLVFAFYMFGQFQAQGKQIEALNKELAIYKPAILPPAIPPTPNGNGNLIP